MQSGGEEGHYNKTNLTLPKGNEVVKRAGTERRAHFCTTTITREKMHNTETRQSHPSRLSTAAIRYILTPTCRLGAPPRDHHPIGKVTTGRGGRQTVVPRTPGKITGLSGSIKHGDPDESLSRGTPKILFVRPRPISPPRRTSQTGTASLFTGGRRVPALLEKASCETCCTLLLSYKYYAL